MNRIRSYLKQLIDDSGHAWNRFWFEPTSPSVLGCLRIGTGVVALLFWLSFWGTLTSWFGSEGLLPLETLKQLTGVGSQAVYRWSLFYLSESPTVLWLIYLIGLLVILAHTVGLGGRLTTLLAWGFLLSMIHRIPMATGLAEPVLSMAFLYLAIGPVTACCSLDQRWRPRPRVPSSFATLSLRLIQIHTLFFYGVMGLTQLGLSTWWQGEAIWTLLASSDTRPLDLTFLGEFPFLLNLLTHGIVAFELLFPILIWQRSLRPLLIVCSWGFWALIALTSGFWLYAALMAILSTAFWPDCCAEKTVSSGEG